MNESMDLRKRILKMRENNELILSTVKSEFLKEDIKKEVKSEDFIAENKEKFNSSVSKTKLADEENTIKSSLFKSKISSQSQESSHNYNNTNNIKIDDTNEAQFRILANKFNEAVEVILELSDKVKKLEHIVYRNHNETKKVNGFFYYINIKILFSVIFIPLLILGILTLPFDFFTFKLIIYDIISSIM
jgi:hypothetical protein